MSSHQVLDNNSHRDLRIRTDVGFDLGDGMMACLTVPTEFRRVQNEYPILFRRDLERGHFSALVLMGFENGENLYLDEEKWDARYRPLALAIQPFLVGRPADDDGPSQVHIDSGHARIATGGEGVRVFDDSGQPSPYLERIVDQLGELDDGFRASAGFFAALAHHKLLEPFSLDVELANGAQHRLVGYHVVDEDRLRALDATALGELHHAGYLLPIFMALASLSNLPALIARKDRRAGNG